MNSNTMPANADGSRPSRIFTAAELDAAVAAIERDPFFNEVADNFVDTMYARCDSKSHATSPRNH